LDDDRSVDAGSSSANKLRFLADRGKEQVIEQVVVVEAANAPTSYQLGNFVNQVPLSLLPYKKDLIALEHARKTYKYRHVLKRNDSTVRLVYNNKSSAIDY
jgi:hypothetical protein